MANWVHKKYALGEVDVFDIQNDYELYGAINVKFELDLDLGDSTWVRFESHNSKKS
jgi:hypothetical protein